MRRENQVPGLGLASLTGTKLPSGQRPGGACSPHGVGNSLSSRALCYAQGSERVHDLSKVSLQPVAALTQDLLLPPIPCSTLLLSPQTSV